MNAKVGRNDSCPCGSGRKYKHCCGRPAAAPTPSTDGHDGAVGRALAWLAQHHRKAFAAALQEAVDEALHDIFDNEDEADAAMAGIDGELWDQVQLNLTEWLLAEGDIHVKGQRERVAELLLGPRGPLLSVGQRAWLEQLSRRPLRLYDVTEVVPGVSLTLCDALDTAQAPQLVIERSGSRSLRVGMQIGARVMEEEGGYHLSGAVYPLAVWAGRMVQARLRERAAQPSRHAEDDVLMNGLAIIEGWLAQHLTDPPVPDIVDSASGDPMLFTTDHYDVLDWAALGSALAAQPDVHGDRDAGRDRLLVGDDGLSRPQATIAPAPGGRRVAVLYKTARLAQRGRAWFDALSGTAVRFRLREVSDPKGVMSRSATRGGRSTAKAPTALPPGLDAESLAGLMETVIRRTYARWADEPIPVLDGQTPRAAICSAAGLERVKGLLRMYEDGEAQQAAQQGRRVVSYQFLWDALSLKR